MERRMVIWMMLENAKPVIGTIDGLMINQVIAISIGANLV
jgi:hypothetical protein